WRNHRPWRSSCVKNHAISSGPADGSPAKGGISFGSPFRNDPLAADLRIYRYALEQRENTLPLRIVGHYRGPEIRLDRGYDLEFEILFGIVAEKTDFQQHGVHGLVIEPEVPEAVYDRLALV